ncbi:alpha/beta hydrolase [uncultured Paludibaculum sp.]|uniref:alpha/beta hydrolase n=1 Tax=uncultured Paludibaculum sp. TaxID=1765020 RepID=UPI002AABCBAA|nr:alpha/beta hydrolase [uncultured Paludibaculum sp.]
MRMLTILLIIAGTVAWAAEPAAQRIWPKGAPGEKGGIGPEADTTKADGALVAGRRVIRLGNVSEPTISVYPAPKNNNTGTAVVVFPGGGYNILAMDLEGTEVCEWLNSIGVTGVLLKYRVPARQGGPRWAAPLQDAQRAIGIVRSRAAELQIDPKKIGVLGFSAGGHLAALASNQYQQRTYDAVDAADQVSSRPDFSFVIYPGYLAMKDQGDKLAAELPVSANTPPTFLVQAEDDGVRVENSIVYYMALKNAKVPAEMHLFAKGGHGYGLRPTELPVTHWPKLAETWLRGLGLIPAVK